MDNVTVTMHTEPKSKLQRFDEFKVGEFLLVESTKAFGVKLNDRSIKFYINAAGKKSDGPPCPFVPPPSARYLVPTSVDISVIR